MARVADQSQPGSLDGQSCECFRALVLWLLWATRNAHLRPRPGLSPGPGRNLSQEIAR